MLTFGLAQRKHARHAQVHRGIVCAELPVRIRQVRRVRESEPGCAAAITSSLVVHGQSLLTRVASRSSQSGSRDMIECFTVLQP
jgi:hypothetical protein